MLRPISVTGCPFGRCSQSLPSWFDRWAWLFPATLLCVAIGLLIWPTATHILKMAWSDRRGLIDLKEAAAQIYGELRGTDLGRFTEVILAALTKYWTMSECKFCTMPTCKCDDNHLQNGNDSQSLTSIKCWYVMARPASDTLAKTGLLLATPRYRERT